MKKILCVLVALCSIFIFTSCSFIDSKSSTTLETMPSNYPNSVVFKIMLSGETYLCSSFNVINTDTEVSLRLSEVYSLSSDGKIMWIGEEKEISAVTIEKLSK